MFDIIIRSEIGLLIKAIINLFYNELKSRREYKYSSKDRFKI